MCDGSGESGLGCIKECFLIFIGVSIFLIGYGIHLISNPAPTYQASECRVIDRTSGPCFCEDSISIESIDFASTSS